MTAEFSGSSVLVRLVFCIDFSVFNCSNAVGVFTVATAAMIRLPSAVVAGSTRSVRVFWAISLVTIVRHCFGVDLPIVIACPALYKWVVWGAVEGEDGSPTEPPGSLSACSTMPAVASALCMSAGGAALNFLVALRFLTVVSAMMLGVALMLCGRCPDRGSADGKAAPTVVVVDTEASPPSNSTALPFWPLFLGASAFLFVRFSSSSSSSSVPGMGSRIVSGMMITSCASLDFVALSVAPCLAPGMSGGLAR